MALLKKNSTTAIEQIDQLIKDVEVLITEKKDFQGFIVISIGIEFLGAFFDSLSFSDFGQSKNRFTNALKKLFKNNWYRTNATWTFENLRGPLVHQYRPGFEILLTSYCKNGVDQTRHLQLEDYKRIFVVEQLFDDFKEAVQKFKDIMKRENSLNKDKPDLEHQTIFAIVNSESVELTTSGATLNSDQNKISIIKINPMKKKKK